jgi:tetratricopeptide (TPR) repeat protein
MRSSATLGEWNRRKTVLVACLAAAAALAALAVALKLPWLGVAGLVVAAVGAMASLVINTEQARLASKRERPELDRRVKVPVAPITGIDPTEIGVDPAATQTVLGATVPEYVVREVDAELRGAIEAALSGAGSWMLVVVGASKVGKSRTLFEALSACSVAERLQLVAPVHGDALRSLLDPGQPMATRPKYAVLWLDDLEPFLAQGVTWQTLREWQSSRPGRIVAATSGGTGSELVAEAATGGLKTLAADILQHAREIALHATNSKEMAPLRGRLSDADLDAVRRHGLAAYLVAGPALQRKLTSQRHALGEPECPEGVAVVHAAVDWARCGRTDPISGDTLRALWPAFLQAGITPNDERFAIGLEWALRPVAATVSLLQDDQGYQAYDYVIRLVRERPGADPPRAPVWIAARGSATPDEAYAVAVAAYAHSRLDDAAAALRRARDSSSTDLAASAGVNLGVVLGELGRPQEALAAYQQVIDDYRDDPSPALREQVARALYNRGATLGKLGRPQEALAAYQQVIDDYRDDPSPALREQVARALNNRGIRLGRLDRQQDALAAYQQLIDDYRDDPSPALREQVARALNNRGIRLGRLDRQQDALAAYQQLIDDYRDDPSPALRKQVARALNNRGVTLGQLNRPQQALAAYQQLIDDYRDDPSLREQVATALNSRGVILGQLNRPQEELTAYQRLIDDYRDDPSPAVREQVAWALYNRGVRLGQLDRPQEALAAYQQLIDDYRDDPSPALRKQVAWALYNRGVTLGQLHRPQQALAAYQQLIDDYRNDPSLREQVARALNNRGVILGQLNRPQEALAAYQQVIDDYRDDPSHGVREQVEQATAARYKLWGTGGPH